MERQAKGESEGEDEGEGGDVGAAERTGLGQGEGHDFGEDEGLVSSAQLSLILPPHQDGIGLGLDEDLRVTELRPGSAAASSGILVHDLLLEINGKQVHALSVETTW